MRGQDIKVGEWYAASYRQYRHTPVLGQRVKPTSVGNGKVRFTLDPTDVKRLNANGSYAPRGWDRVATQEEVIERLSSGRRFLWKAITTDTEFVARTRDIMAPWDEQVRLLNDIHEANARRRDARDKEYAIRVEQRATEDARCVELTQTLRDSGLDVRVRYDWSSENGKPVYILSGADALTLLSR